jgi:hypothetical protein
LRSPLSILPAGIIAPTFPQRSPPSLVWDLFCQALKSHIARFLSVLSLSAGESVDGPPPIDSHGSGGGGPSTDRCSGHVIAGRINMGSAMT